MLTFKKTKFTATLQLATSSYIRMNEYSVAIFTVIYSVEVATNN